MDDLLKAEHCVEEESGMQAWVEAVGIAAARIVKAMKGVGSFRSFLRRRWELSPACILSAILIHHPQ
jgi:hypothetical protein